MDGLPIIRVSVDRKKKSGMLNTYQRKTAKRTEIWLLLCCLMLRSITSIYVMHEPDRNQYRVTSVLREHYRHISVALMGLLQSRHGF